MRTIVWFVGIGFVVAIVVATVTAFKLGIGSIRALFDGLDLQTGVVLGVSVAALLLCSMMIAAAIRSAGRWQSEASRRRERAKIYPALLASITMGELRVSEPAATLTATLFLIGGGPVVTEFQALIQVLSSENSSEELVRNQLNRLMLAMRRDLGESAFGLEKEDWSGWLENPVAIKTGEPTNGTASVQRTEFVFPTVRLPNRA